MSLRDEITKIIDDLRDQPVSSVVIVDAIMSLKVTKECPACKGTRWYMDGECVHGASTKVTKSIADLEE